MAKQTQEQKTREAVETMERAAVLRARVLEAVRAVDRSYLDLASGLAEIYHDKHFETWGFTNFEAYCTSELDFTYRKAKFLIEIWDKVQGHNIPRDRVERIGWTKMKEIVRRVTAENCEELLRQGEELSVSQLSEQLKVAAGGGDSSGTTVVKLKMNSAEAAIIMECIDAAKKLVNSDNAVSALEMVCQDWMEAHGHSPEKVSLEQHLAYLSKVYGVNVVAADVEDAEEVAEESQAENVKEEKEPQGIEDLLEDHEAGETKEVVEKKAEPAKEQDIDAILGMV